MIDRDETLENDRGMFQCLPAIDQHFLPKRFSQNFPTPLMHHRRATCLNRERLADIKANAQHSFVSRVTLLIEKNICARGAVTLQFPLSPPTLLGSTDRRSLLIVAIAAGVWSRMPTTGDLRPTISPFQRVFSTKRSKIIDKR